MGTIPKDLGDYQLQPNHKFYIAMFDDNSLEKPGQVPGNLPTNEPDDILAGADVGGDSASALEAGVLRPKTEMPPTNPDKTMGASGNFTGLPPELDSRAPDVSEPEPATGHRTLTLVLLVLVLVIVGGGGFWVYANFVKAPATVSPEPVITQPAKTETTPVQNTEPEQTVTQDTTVIVSTTLEDSILEGQPLDTDADGLTDDQEKEKRTDPLSWDTDGDLLSDGDEVNTWQTNPLVADTDGDSYKDGDEIRNGYNPKGPGKLFQPGQGPTTTTATASSTR